MPLSLTYPGVYVEEIPSGVHTITGVSTSDSAFVDVFARGLVNQATRITSLADFERIFGGLDSRSEASYAIQQFFLNGGSAAWVVRIAPANAAPATLDLLGSSPPQATLQITAGQMGPNNTVIGNPGQWGNNLQAAVTCTDPTCSKANVFNLFIREVVTRNGQQQVLNTETYRNLTMDKTKTNYAPNVVNNNSALVYLTDLGLGAGETPAAVVPGPDGGVPADKSGQPSAWVKFSKGVDGSVLDTNGNLLDSSGFRALLAGDRNAKSGMYALDAIAPFIFNILCIPAAAKLDAASSSLATPLLANLAAEAEAYCVEKRAFYVVDIPPFVNAPDKMTKWMNANPMPVTNAAVYFPRLQILDHANSDLPRDVGPSGTLAGVYARIDATRGVWKAPAGTEAVLQGANIAVHLTDNENGGLNPLGVNVLRNFPVFGNISWGARTLQGADQLASEWKYIPVRRMALYIEESLYEGLKWVVFEPNDEPLWASIRLNVGAFMQNLFRQGAFQGRTPKEAYFVKCDSETTTQYDIDRGVVNIVVGFAPLKPAEFVVIQLQQKTAQAQS